MPNIDRRPTAVTTTASAAAPPRVRTLIVDDSETVRNGLSLLFETQPSCELVGAVGDPDVALELTRTARPHVVLQDFSMPGVDTLGLMRSLAECDPQPAILVLSAFADGPSARKAMAAGALGWLLKDAEPAELFAAVLGAAGLHAGEPAGGRDGSLQAVPAAPAPAPVPAQPPAPGPVAVVAPAVPLPPRPDLEVATPVDPRTLWAVLRALESDLAGLPLEALASRAVVTVSVAARYVQRMTSRHPGLAAVAGMTPEGPRYALTAAGHRELARLEGRTVAGLPPAATQLLQ
jgi:CheY-like chemotaxis protein